MQHSATPGSTRRAVFRWLLLAGVLALAVMGYLSQRQRIFTVLAAGTEWVLVNCGLATPDDAAADDQLRRLYYAARMFRAVPPRQLVPMDVWAEQTWPGMGFGLIRTFDTRPVALVIGGWLFRIPCTYLADARQCARADAKVARLRVDVDSLAPISAERVAVFLAAASPEIVRITLLGAADVTPLAPGYQARAVWRVAADGRETTAMMQCLDPALARTRTIAEHCLLQFPFNADVVIELHFSAAHRDDWERLRRESLALVAGFAVRQ